MHFRLDGTADDIARCEFAEFMVFLHEAFAADGEEFSAFAAHCLGDEEMRRAVKKERRRMELHEFHVNEFAPGSPRRSDAVAGGDFGVRCAGIETAEPACRQNRRFGVERDVLSFNDSQRAIALVFRCQHLKREGVGENVYAFRVEHLLHQDIGCLPPGGIAFMDDAAAAMGGFSREPRQCAFPIKSGTPVNKFSDARNPFGYQRFNSRNIAEASTSGKRVLDMEREGIVHVHGDSDASLRIAGVALLEDSLRQQGHVNAGHSGGSECSA